MRLKFNNKDAVHLLRQNMCLGNLSVAQVRKPEFVEKLRVHKFDSLEQKKLVLHGWLKICVTKDMANAIFVCNQEGFCLDPSLDRSIARGKADNWVTREIVQTDKGISVKWFLENKSGCS